MKVHNTNLGRFGHRLTTDKDGYVYTTAEEYLQVLDIDDDIEYAQECADRANAAIEALSEWQDEFYDQ